MVLIGTGHLEELGNSWLFLFMPIFFNSGFVHISFQAPMP